MRGVHSTDGGNVCAWRPHISGQAEVMGLRGPPKVCGLDAEAHSHLIRLSCACLWDVGWNWRRTSVVWRERDVVMTDNCIRSHRPNSVTKWIRLKCDLKIFLSVWCERKWPGWSQPHWLLSDQSFITIKQVVGEANSIQICVKKHIFSEVFPFCWLINASEQTIWSWTYGDVLYYCVKACCQPQEQKVSCCCVLLMRPLGKVGCKNCFLSHLLCLFSSFSLSKLLPLLCFSVSSQFTTKLNLETFSMFSFCHLQFLYATHTVSFHCCAGAICQTKSNIHFADSQSPFRLFKGFFSNSITFFSCCQIQTPINFQSLPSLEMQMLKIY